MSTESFGIKLNELFKPYKADDERQLVIHTGQDGLNIFHLEIQKRNNADFADFLCQKKLIAQEE